jgi:hypothetical protein
MLGSDESSFNLTVQGAKVWDKFKFSACTLIIKNSISPVYCKKIYLNDRFPDCQPL